LLDDCYVIGCLLRITFIVVTLLVSMSSLALVVVGRWKHLLTYYYIVILLGLFGIIFLGGLEYLLFCLWMLQVIFINSILLEALLKQDVSSFRLFGLLQCERFGKKEIIEYSLIKIAPYYKW